MTEVTPTELIQSRILVLRGQRVIIDADLAALYGVPTKRLNEQVRRNARKFPDDFVFRLTREEVETVHRSRSQSATQTVSSNRSQNATGSLKHRDPRFLPYAFTEHGAIQAANILNSDAATEMSVQVVRAFVHLRHLIVNHKALSAKLSELDARVGAHTNNSPRSPRPSGSPSRPRIHATAAKSASITATSERSVASRQRRGANLPTSTLTRIHTRSEFGADSSPQPLQDK